MTAFMTNLLMGVRLLRVTLRYWLSNIRSVLVETRAELDMSGYGESKYYQPLITSSTIPYLEDR